MSRNKFYQYNSLSILHEHSINLETREIYLHGHENSETSEIEHKSAIKFIKNLRFLDRANSPIIVYLQNYGGCVDDGMAIYDVIKNATSYIIMICDGYCQSMATIILQAADVRLMMPHCTFMVHDGESSHLGSTDAVISYTDELKKSKALMRDIFVEKMISGPFFKDYSSAKVRRYLNDKLKTKGDWYLSSDEAINYGFADGIFGQGKYTLDKLLVS